MPKNMTYKNIIEYINLFPEKDDPLILGLHPNCDI